MNDNPARERVKKSEMVQWLLEHREVWEGFPKPIQPPDTQSHAWHVFAAMKYAGLFAPRSQCNPLTISRLVKLAQAAQQLNEAGEKRSMEMANP